MSATELFDAAVGYPWMSGPSTAAGLLALAVRRRMLRRWLRMILAVIVAVGVGVGIALGTAWALAGATEGNANCACAVEIRGVFG